MNEHVGAPLISEVIKVTLECNSAVLARCILGQGAEREIPEGIKYDHV